MKRFYALLLAACLLAILPGCGKSPVGSASASVSAASAEADGEVETFRISSYECQVTIPKAWSGICETYAYDSGIDFISAANRDFGGIAFGILMAADGSQSDYFDFCDGEPVLLARDEAHGISFYRVHPYTDVEYDPDNAARKAEYQMLLDGEEAVCATFVWRYTGESVEPDVSAPQTGAADWPDTCREIVGQDVCFYDVYDVDGDGVPELFVKTGTCEADYQYTLYARRDGEAVNCGSFSASHAVLAGLNGSGSFVVLHGQMLYEQVLVYPFSNGVLGEPRTVFEGEVKDYAPFTAIPEYAFDDDSGWNWTGNSPDDNQSVLDALA